MLSSHLINKYIKEYGERNYRKIVEYIYTSKHTQKFIAFSVRENNVPHGSQFVDCVSSNIKYIFANGDKLLVSSLSLLMIWLESFEDYNYPIDENLVLEIETEIVKKQLLTNSATSSNIILREAKIEVEKRYYKKDSIHKEIQSSRDFISTQIGNQLWMKENLDVSHFFTGDIIKQVSVSEMFDGAWLEANEKGIPVWCYYDDDKTHGLKNGKLYNWHAVADVRGLAPKGWEIPNKNDFIELLSTLGDNTAYKLKSTQGWPIGQNGSNSSGFNALASGIQTYDGFPIFSGESSYWWTRTPVGDKAYALELFSSREDAKIVRKDFAAGFSVRCIKHSL